LHHRPSYPSLRRDNNGDRHLEVGAGSAPEKLGPTPWTHSPRTLPPLGSQPGATPAGKLSGGHRTPHRGQEILFSLHGEAKNKCVVSAFPLGYLAKISEHRRPPKQSAGTADTTRGGGG